VRAAVADASAIRVAVVSAGDAIDRATRRGHTGLAGKIAHVHTTGADGRGVAFTTVFEQLGLRHTGSTAIDVSKLLARVADPDEAPLTDILATPGCDVLAAAIALCDPQLVVIGGDWGTAAPVFEAVQARMTGLPRSVPLDLARARGNSAFPGARSAAVDQLRASIIARSKTT
jgi:predicted NBD/HSP70 family sugar kinase